MVVRWQALNADVRSRLSVSAHSSNGNSFGELPVFGGNQENVPPTPKKRGRPAKARTPMVSHSGSVLGADEIRDLFLPSPLKVKSSLSDVTDEERSLLGKRPALEELKVDQDGIVRLPGDKGAQKKSPKSSKSSFFLTNAVVKKMRARELKEAEKAAKKKLVPLMVEERLLLLEQTFERESEEKNSLIKEQK